MNYSNLSSNHQRLDIAAFGYRHEVKPDCYDFRNAIDMEDIAQDACRFHDKNKSIIRFAIFLKAVKIAYLQPKHIVSWLGRNRHGQDAIKKYAVSQLGMKES